MLKAMVSLSTYRHPTLDHSLYLMTLIAAAGYFVVIGGGALLDRLGESVRRREERPMGAQRTELGKVLGTLLRTLADERWVWITPVILVITLYLSVIFQPGHAETGPVMYALF